MDDGVLFYLKVDDSTLRRIGWQLLDEGLIHSADRIDSGSIVLEGPRKKQKVRHSGVVGILHADREKQEAVMNRIKSLAAGESYRVYVLPVLAHAAQD